MSVRRAGVAISLLFGLAGPAYADDPQAPAAAAPAGEEAKEAKDATEAKEGGEAKEAAEPKEAVEPKEGEGEEEEGITYWAEVPLTTSYVWRGELLSTGGLSPTVQPEAEIHFPGVGPGSIMINLWMNRALTADADGLPNSAFEFDPQVAYDLPISDVTLRLGYIGYLYLDAESPEPIDNQHDFFAQAKLEKGLPVKPYLAAYVDPIRYKGFYGAAGAIHDISFMDDKLSFETQLNLGVSSYSLGDVGFGLQDVTLTSRGEYLITDLFYVALTVGVAYAGRAEAGDPRVLPYALLAIGLGN
ncbi:MAG TPA: hypothetical protein VIG99_19085 [Myxococcaceae bacterium]|jgi:hypothetical protein